MIKMTICLRRKKHLSLAEFQDYWLTKHAPLVRKHQKTLRICRYIQLHTRSDVMAIMNAGRVKAGLPPAPEPYDGFVEMWWNSLADFEAVQEEPAAQLARKELFHDERQFIDHANSLLTYGEEKIIIA